MTRKLLIVVFLLLVVTLLVACGGTPTPIQTEEAPPTEAVATEETVEQASRLGMLVSEEEGLLVEARTRLITARAA